MAKGKRRVKKLQRRGKYPYRQFKVKGRRTLFPYWKKYPSKKLAQAEAKRMRKDEYHARVVPYKGQHAVFVRSHAAYRHGYGTVTKQKKSKKRK